MFRCLVKHMIQMIFILYFIIITDMLLCCVSIYEMYPQWVCGCKWEQEKIWRNQRDRMHDKSSLFLLATIRPLCWYHASELDYLNSNFRHLIRKRAKVAVFVGVAISASFFLHVISEFGVFFIIVYFILFFSGRDSIIACILLQ